MADHYYAYDPPPADRASVARTNFAGYFPTEETLFQSHQYVGATHLQNVSSDYPQREITPALPVGYGYDDTAGLRAHHEFSNVGGIGGTTVRGYSPSPPDRSLVREDATRSITPAMPDKPNEIPSSVRNVGSSAVVGGESNMLFVDGLPADCSRREVGHLFRPFIGYKDIKVVHREPRRTGDKAMVLCFVEFVDSKCAMTAMNALQGYKFDDKKINSPVLRIQFAQFPFHLPSDSDELQTEIPH